MVVQSFSKSYCMTGWRVGWLVARQDLAATRHPVERVHHLATRRASPRAPAETALPGAKRNWREMLARLQGQPRLLPGGARRDARRDGPQPGWRVLPVPQDRRDDGFASTSAAGCWSRPRSAWRPEWRSARAAKAPSASATPPSGRFWRPPWTVCPVPSYAAMPRHETRETSGGRNSRSREARRSTRSATPAR